MGVQSIQLLYETSPQIDGSYLLGELRKYCGRVDRLGEKKDLHYYAFLDHPLQLRDKVIFPQMLLGYPDEGKEKSDYEDSFQQTWDWKEAREVVSTCRIPLLMTDLMVQSLNQRSRLNLFHNALEAILTVAPCKAIHWATSQKFVDPIAYLNARKSKDIHPLQFSMNVRFYNITGQQQGEMLMDTVGLSLLGLPDLQCHFFGLDPNQVARMLYNSAYYIFDNGDIIEDGNTIQGIAPSDKWKCQHEVALIKPEREVLDINPGKPYAVGNR